ncbi:MAG: hypothetical protein IJK93_06075 [Muribaculaceae bacterium]|nr:hypothetical protein [Muribaculaceae bacterium]
MTNKKSLYIMMTLAVLFLSLSTLSSCNKDNDDSSAYSYSTSQQTTLVTGFALQADADVLANLDSVHFTVDYDKGLIYNADSLPKGTDVTALKVTVEFLNTVSSAVFDITGATVQADTTINYTTSSTKSIDFTGKTVLTVVSADETQVKKYDVKVLVHKENPDTLIFPQSWRRDLPGYRYTAIGHKAVKQGDLYRIMNYNGIESFLFTAESPNQGTWDKQKVNLPFAPQIPSLAATDDALYMLADDGTLYTSPDGMEWTSCGVTWYSVLGAYDGRVLGIVKGDDAYYHDEYPRTEGFEATRVEDGFPISHSSGMIVTDNKWTVAQQAMVVGGMDSQGNVLSDVWGYDGNHWGKINNIHSSALPALTEATVFSYYTYKALSGTRRYGRQSTWYVMGGKLADGSLNKNIYLSNTQGITWTKADSTICQPNHMPKFYGAQAFVNFETLTTAGMANAPRRVTTPVTSWECPYIYLFGGYNDQGVLLPYLWRGVYNRLTNYPVY